MRRCLRNASVVVWLVLAMALPAAGQARTKILLDTDLVVPFAIVG